jgi:hypothetical protein
VTHDGHTDTDTETTRPPIPLADPGDLPADLAALRDRLPHLTAAELHDAWMDGDLRVRNLLDLESQRRAAVASGLTEDELRAAHAFLAERLRAAHPYAADYGAGALAGLALVALEHIVRGEHTAEQRMSLARKALAACYAHAELLYGGTR